MSETPGLRPLAFVVLFCALAIGSRQGWAQGSCSPISPADQGKKTPLALWGEIQPVGTILDATRYNGNQRADSLFPQVTSVDVENGYLFASYWAGFGIWDLRTTPDAPVLLSLIDGWKGGFPKWSGVSETDQFLYAIDAPAGDDTIFALGGIAPAGLSIWDARSKSAPVLLYQDFNKDIAQVYAATIGGRAYAFAGGAFSGNEFGLFIYDMTRARANNNACSEDASGGPRTCTGVYIAKIDTGGGPVQYVHGLQFGARHFIVTSPGQGAVHGVQIWDVTNPAVPKKVVAGFTASGLATFTSGVALWQQSNSALLAIRFQDTLQVFDVTACLTAGCPALPSPLSTLPVAAVTESNYWKTVSFSRAGGTPMLFLGNQLFCHAEQGPGHVEYVLDMTNPAAPRDITPPGTTVYALPSAPANSELVDYWSYYYRDDIKGFFELASRDGKLYQAPSGRTFLYRAAVTLFDVHEWVGRNPAPAVAGVTPSPAAPLVCQPVTFTANGVTGRPPLTFNWTVTNSAAATVATGTANPFTWTTAGMAPGSYTARVTVHNGLGPDATAAAPVTLGALGALASTGPPANDPFTGRSVTFHPQAKAATEWNWDFGNGRGYQGWSSVADPTFTYAAAGTYKVKVKIRNCLQATEIESAPLTVVVGDSVVIQVFLAQCNVAPCSFSANLPITFAQAVLGNPSQLQYDWDGNGTFDQTVAVTGAVADSIAHTYAAAGQYTPVIRAIRGAEPPVDFRHPPLTVSPGSGVQLKIDGPGTGTTNSLLTFTATAVNCTPVAAWSWNPAGGTLSGTGSQVTISWPTAGTKAVSVTNSGCGAATGHLSVSIADASGGLGASFTFSPAAPAAGTAVSFDGSASTGGPVSFAWDFGDGQTANSGGATASHTYTAAGSYTVKLEVGKPGSGCPFGVCSAVTTRSVTVLPGGPQTQAAVSAQAGAPVSFTATPANATSYTWSFGDGGSATGAQVTHTWTQNGTFTVQLTASGGPSPAVSSLTVVVSGAAARKAVVVPWAAQDAAQSSDLYVFNPAASPIDVTLTFFVRGPAEADPPKSSSTIPPGSTLFVPNAVGSLFNRPGATGFITVTVDRGDVEPVATLFHTTAKPDGSTYGQTISGVSMSAAGSSATPPARHLVGLGNNGVLISSFGVSNPGADTQACTLRIFDSTGKAAGTPQSFSIARSSQRQFLPKEIQTLFGVANLGDYRVEVQGGGGQLVPFSANLSNGSNDPSFVGAVAAAPAKVHLLGALSLPAAGGSTWQTDAVLANPSTGVVTTDVIYTGTGPAASPTPPLRLTLQPGETRRLPDLIGTQWSLRNTVGALTLSSTSTDGVFPVVQGQSTSVVAPGKRIGQLMPAMDESQAAGVNATQVLAGLRQDAKHSTNVWVFNPGGAPASVDVVYLGLDGHEIGRTAAFAVGPGAIRQIILAQKLPAGGVPNGLTVQVQVKSGKILAAAQVVSTGTNDPAYVAGVTR